MNKIKLAFVANDDKPYDPGTPIGDQLGFITWTPSKLRIFLSDGINIGDVIELNHHSQLKQFSSYWSEEDVINFLPQFILRTFLPKNGEDLVELLESFLGKESSILRLIRVVTPEIDLITYLKQIIKLIYSINQQDILLNYFISAPKIKFYLRLNDNKDIQSLLVTDKDRYNGFIDIYVGGEFQENKLYGGASPEGKDIEITASCNGESDSIMTMIRVRRNANELTKKAKENYLEALNAINHLLDQNNEIIEGTSGMGIYTTDFFKMHVKGSKSIAHGTEVFLPWHRLYTLDIERQLQKIKPEVSLHYWKFDEPAPNVFKADFLGESVYENNKLEDSINIQGLALNFAKFDENNPLKYWAIDKEKLIRRKTWYDNQNKKSGNYDNKNKFNDVKSDRDVILGKEYLRKNIIKEDGTFGADNKSFSGMEGDPHGAAHDSNGGFLNYVPTAAKDPLFYFLHSNVERLYSKWQQITFKKWDEDRSQSIKSYPFNAYDASDSRVYENLSKSIKWKNKDTALWPWNGNTTPNDYQLLPVGTRANNFTKSHIGRNFTNPTIENAIDAFGINNIKNYLGFSYDDFNDLSFVNNQDNNLLKSLNDSPHLLMDSSSNIIASLERIIKYKDQLKANENKEQQTQEESLATVLNKITFNSIFSSDFEFDKANLNAHLINVLPETNDIKIVDFIINSCVLNELQDVFYQFENNFRALKNDLTQDNILKYSRIEKDNKGVDKEIPYEKQYSKYLTFYLLSLYGEDIISDADRVEVFRNNVGYFSYIRKEALEEALDIAITLLCFASNNIIKNKIAPILFKESQLDINDLKSKTNPKNLDMESPYLHKNDTPEEKKHKNAQYRASMANKYWALHTLLTNAGVEK